MEIVPIATLHPARTHYPQQHTTYNVFQYMGLPLLVCFWQSVRVIHISYNVYYGDEVKSNCSELKIIWAQNIPYQQPLSILIRGFHKAGFVFPAINKTFEVFELTVCGYLADELKIHLLPHLIIGVTLGCFPDSCCHGGCIHGDKSPWRQGETDNERAHRAPLAMWKRCTWKQDSAIKECRIRCSLGGSVY